MIITYLYLLRLSVYVKMS